VAFKTRFTKQVVIFPKLSEKKNYMLSHTRKRKRMAPENTIMFESERHLENTVGKENMGRRSRKKPQYPPTHVVCHLRPSASSSLPNAQSCVVDVFLPLCPEGDRGK
jgi:hypothetical protein